MEGGSIAKIGYIGLTGLHTLLLLLAVLQGRAPRLSFSRAKYNWNSATFFFPPLLLIVASLWALYERTWQWNSSHPHLDVYTCIAVIVSALALLAAASVQLSTTVQLLYDVFCCLIWTLSYPFIGSDLTTVIVPFMYLLHGAALLVRAGGDMTLHGSNGVHPLTKQSSFLSQVTLGWLSPLLKKSLSGSLDTADVWDVDEHQNVRRFLGETGDSKANFIDPGKPLPESILELLIDTYPRLMLGSAALEIGYLVLAILQPFLLQILIEKQSRPVVVATFVAGIFLGAFYYHSLFIVRLVGMRLRAAMTALVCDKGMVVPRNAGNSGVEPSVLNEVDLFNVFKMVEVVNELWVVPLHASLSIGALVYILGWQSILAGSIAALLVVPVLIWVINIMARRLAKYMAAKDSRVTFVKEVLASIKHVKLYGWQEIFERKIDDLRALELKALGRVAIPNLLSNALSSLLPAILVSVSFGTHIITTGSLRSSVIFPSLILFNGMSRWMEQLPRTIMTWKTGVVSYRRVRGFLMTEGHSDAFCAGGEPDPKEQPGVTMKGVSIAAPGSKNEFGSEEALLKDVEFHAAPGSLTVISGSVGSGKTTLLRTIIGEIRPQHGSIDVSGRVAYSSQRPFLINGSIRENILFGLTFDGPWYEKVLHSVCLSADLAQLPYGDATVLGGAGQTISGGQQSRVALARAVYSRRPLVVLDDPIAAVDPKVQRSLINNVFGPNSILKDSTRIVTTSNQALIQMATAVYTIDNGTLKLLPQSPIGTVHETSLVHEQNACIEDREFSSPNRHSYGTLKPAANFVVNVCSADELDGDLESTPLVKRSAPAKLSNKGVAFSTYVEYLASGKPWGWSLVLCLAATCTFLEIRGVYYLQEAGQEFETVGHSNKLAMYSICRAIGSACVGLFVFTGYFAGLIPACRSLHAKLTRGVLESKFSFFDTTPLGAILSRFTTDMNKIDGPAGSGFISLCMIGTNVVCSILVVVSTSATSVLYLVPLAILYVYIQRFYMSAYRQLRRLDNEARGPILNAANEMIVGLSVIMAYQQAEFFRQRARDVINNHLRVWAPFLCLDIWLQLRLYTLACVVQGLTAALLLSIGAPSATLGLVMSFVLQITNLLGFVVQSSANLEADLTSLERISEYTHNLPEDDSTNDITPLPFSWPTKPSVTFELFSASYLPNGPPCLRNLNFRIPEGQRVAVVGRTGSGKSSLVLALMRAIDRRAVVPGSRILIDGVDIMSEVSLSQLRKAVTVIPQDPVVFSGTIRDNLDPAGCKSEEELRNAIAATGLVNVLGLEPGEDPLEFQVADSGRGLSTGQTQLLAIARAIVAKPKIVLVDEATSSMDFDTAVLINSVMRRAFQGITVITVAHQIWSVVDYDSILILNQGSVVEYDKPDTLLQNPKSWFSGLAKDAGVKKTTNNSIQTDDVD